MTDWKFAARERQLFEEVGRLPTGKLANQSRRMLASMVHQLSLRETAVPGLSVADLDYRVARKLAVVQLGFIVVRSVGAIISLVSCGYERESLGIARTLLEASWRARQVSDDASGDVARGVLAGRPPKSMKTLAHRYGTREEVNFLDRFAHADVLSTFALAAQPLDPASGEVHLEIRPTRGQARPALQLYQAAYQAVSFTGPLAEVFCITVEIPRWIMGQMQHYRDNPLPPPL